MDPERRTRRSLRRKDIGNTAGVSRYTVSPNEFFLPQNAPGHSEVPPVAAEGRHLARGAQEAEKTHVAPLTAHLSYALEHGTAEDSLTSP